MGEKKSDTVRVLIADEHGTLRNLLHRLFERDPEFEIVGLAKSGEEAVELAALRSPSVVVMGACLRGIGGVEGTRIISGRFPRIRVVGYSWADQEVPMRAAGAFGFVKKGQTTGELIEAVRVAGR